MGYDGIYNLPYGFRGGGIHSNATTVNIVTTPLSAI